MEPAAIVSGSSLLLYNRSPRQRSALIIGLIVALILHLALAAYLITQTLVTISTPVAQEPERPVDGQMVSLVRPDLTPPPVNIHKPEDLRPTPEPLIANPPENPGLVVSTDPPDSLPQSGGTVAGPPSTGTGTVAVAASPKWSRFPGPEALSAYYPPRALDAEVEGTATLECTVLDTKGRVACVIISEKPGGYGFGEATRKMVERIGCVETGQGANPVGTVMRLSVAWQLPS